MPDFLAFAQDATRQAGRLLCELYHQQHSVRYKSSEIDLVTEADLASDRFLVEAIQAQFPDHAILSEEGMVDLKEEIENIPYLWLVDPLDGTVNYAHGFPVWSVSLALAEHGQIIVGVTYDPLSDEMFWAVRGKGAWCNERQMQVSQPSQLQQALVATGFHYSRATQTDNNLAEFSAVMPQVQGIRRTGSAVLDLAYVADGRLDAYWEIHLNPWDWATGCLLVQEAGGKVTGRHGEPWSLTMDHVLASNGQLHNHLLALLRAARSFPEDQIQ